jgi:hypothetical protein
LSGNEGVTFLWLVDRNCRALWKMSYGSRYWLSGTRCRHAWRPSQGCVPVATAMFWSASKLDLAVPDGGVRHVLDLCRVARVYNLPALVVLMRPMRAIWLTRTVPRFIGSEPLQYHMAAR